MDNKLIKKGLQERRTKLNDHLDKFNQLKAEGDYTSAWKQLLITLEYANDTLKESANILKDVTGDLTGDRYNIKDEKCGTIAKTMTSTEPTKTLEEQPIKRMIVIPKKQSVH